MSFHEQTFKVLMKSCLSSFSFVAFGTIVMNPLSNSKSGIYSFAFLHEFFVFSS